MNATLVRPGYSEPRDDEKTARPKVFLAGPIQGAPEWNNWLIGELSDLDAIIYDPRRDTMDGFDYAEQVSWETQHLDEADIVAFSFVNPLFDVEGRSYAQTSRLELGETLARAGNGDGPEHVAIFADTGFPGSKYFSYKANVEYPAHASFHTDWKAYVMRLRAECTAIAGKEEHDG